MGGLPRGAMLRALVPRVLRHSAHPSVSCRMLCAVPSSPDVVSSSPSPVADLTTPPDVFAVVSIGGKQYKVSADDVLMAEKLEAEVGSTLEFPEVLLVGHADGRTWVGKPHVEGAVVAASVEEQTRTAKVHVFKKKRRKNYRRFNSHRQDVTILRVDDIKYDALT